jgi:hypothetical protein
MENNQQSTLNAERPMNAQRADDGRRTLNVDCSMFQKF